MSSIKWKGLHSGSIAYSATTIGSALMGSIFNTYYVKIYLDRFNVTENWFHVSQIVFMIWNAINDPLFGYIQDNFSFSWVKTRRHSILYGAPLFVVSFWIPWIPWGDYSQPTTLAGIQLMFSLCFYDTWFTFVLLAQCALFTEMSPLPEDRIRLIKYSQVASMIGSNAVLITGLVTNNLENYELFVFCCIIAGILALMCMVYTGLKAETQYDRLQDEVVNGHVSREQTEKSDNLLNKAETPQIEYSVWRQMWQIAKQRNFLSFVLMNLCQIYQKTYLYNFVIIICDSLISQQDLSISARSTFYGSLHIIPQVLTLVATGTPFVQRYGYYDIINKSFIFKIALGCGLFLLGSHWWSLVLFFILGCAECSAVFHLFNLPLSDVIDIDKEKYKRKSPLSSLVYGTNALITKPAHSFAPMVAVAVLKRYGYNGSHSKQDAKLWASPEYMDLQNVMFLLTCATPVVIGLLQLVIWSFYKVKDRTPTTSTKYVEA